METVISKRQKAKIQKSVTNINSTGHPLRHRTLKEALKDPFVRKKHEDAKATLEKYPVPDWILERKKANLSNQK